MRTALLIGIGAGDPDQLTIEAVNALNTVDVFFVNDKRTETADMVALREEICRQSIRDHDYRIVYVADPERERSGPDYDRAVRSWHAARVEIYQRLLVEELPPDGCAGFLVWGDPSLYDSTIRIMDAVGLPYRVIPGISSLQILTARFKVTLNEIGGPICITTGRRLLQETFAPEATIAVMLDGGLACQHLDLAAWNIYWGAYLGAPDEVLVSGQLGTVIDDIAARRARLRAEKGWIMDTYLLRRRPS